MVYLRASGRFEVQVAVMTGQGVMGNYNMHTTVRLVHDGKVYEVPALTGNALKHWHSVHAAKAYEALGGTKLNEYCRAGVGLRGKNLNGQDADSEADAIEDFCNDLHGFLIPNKQIKRDSLAKFAFAIPVLAPEVLESVSKFAVTHNRVDPTKKGEETEMMVFRQEYSSGHLYGFAASFDLAYLMVPIYDVLRGGAAKAKANADEKTRRARAAFAGLIAAISGGYGSKAARALPISDLKELVVAVSQRPIPPLIHGAYQGYAAKSLDVLEAYLHIVGGAADVVCYGVECPSGSKAEVKRAGSLKELVEIVDGLIRQYIGGEKASEGR
jgi:CRISPR-associated protein Cst2